MEYADRPLDDDLPNGLHLSEGSRQDLDEAARWARFLAILGFVGVGLMVLGGLFFVSFAANLPGLETAPFPPALFGLFYVAGAVLYFMPILYLFRFARHAREGVRRSDTRELESAFSNIKAHYKFIGILAVVILSLYALGIVFAVLAGLTETLAG